MTDETPPSKALQPEVSIAALRARYYDSETKIPIARRVMPSIVLNDIKGVSPMTAPNPIYFEKSREYYARLEEFEQTNPDATKQDIIDFKKQLMKQLNNDSTV